jgi:3-phenylpropionate/trans-cinnamate dioxygenase ferredoxin reductase subunit
VVQKRYKYIIIGGGMAADSAVRGIRQVDERRSIGMFSMEADPPYNRPPLSKGLWQGKPIERIWRKTADLGVDLYLERKIVSLDAANKLVKDNLGVEYKYDKLLLATGGAANRLESVPDKVIFYRTVEDYRRLRSLAEKGKRFVVIGGGFIGSELAAALASLGKSVTMVFPEENIGARSFPFSTGEFLSDFYKEKGVRVLNRRRVKLVKAEGEQLLAQVTGGEVISADGVVAGMGIQLNLDLATQAGLAVNNGVVVDANLQTSQADIFAAGDIISFYNSSLDMRLRVEHEENANHSGLAAGLSMAGKPEPYDFLPSFYSDLFELSYEAIGDLNPRYQIVADWVELYHKGVVYYLKDGRVRGVMLWNTWKKLDEARRLIASPGPFTPVDLLGRIV